ncbi:hypothetical protein QJS10_CPA08g01619 [Acorus calamus]|uniref:CRM-domain containing factor CFM3, chloroplastic/mitochondrial n=1 Tax=Acorus calamus TaxID=4465 RepID=A0AAV9EDD8_ACOCL|nr:hypothetical protein QJS10_CPA08g01619 [Acorus calamus]
MRGRKGRRVVEEEVKEENVPMVAELIVPATELRRLRGEGIKMRKKMKVGKAGVTEGIVNGIHERWRRSELVKIKCDDLCRFNMKRTHEILERKTGGLVVWRSGSIIILYRGANYKYPYFLSFNAAKHQNAPGRISSESVLYGGVDSEVESKLLCTVGNESVELPNASSHPSLVFGVGAPKKVRFQLPGEQQVEEETDALLDGLGPRFTDWWGYDPLPIDADLLPPTVHGYRKPFRLLPYGVKPKLTDAEMTTLRRLGRPLPCHFALGRNRNLQGLALSMLRLWEKCEIAKVAVKRGVQNTNSEIMAEELKRLTGGTLLSRDKEFIVFYRGKDFLPPAVSTAIQDRRNHELYKDEHGMENNVSSDTRAEFVGLFRDSAPLDKPLVGCAVDNLPRAHDKKRSRATERKSISNESAVKSMDFKLSLALEKKARAEKLLEELESKELSRRHEVDKEAISEEERHMLRRVGLSMKAFLLMGRRGVFDGTIENMHLHWKYRELVKIISKDKCIEDVHRTARTLEVESGGVLVAVERVNKGHAIIVYRGKNYRRPADLRPRTLLNKKEAMKRSLEAQRYQSLKLHVLELNKNIEQLKHLSARDDAEVDCIQSTEYAQQNTGIEKRDFSSLEKSSCHQDLVEEGHEADPSPLKSDACMHSLRNAEEVMHVFPHPVGFSVIKSTTLLDDQQEIVSKYEDQSLTEEKSSSLPALQANEIHNVMGCTSEDLRPYEAQVLTSHPTTGDTPLGDYESTNSTFKSGQNKSNISSISEVKVHEVSDDLTSFRVPPLSNRERLMLRKQALKMRKRPVLSVGRSNIVAGVGKTIKTHFKKYPLAIVNIKGRAKGTSVQELIFELEQTTGAILVSREPNKVILYRGYGGGEGPSVNKAKGNQMKSSRWGHSITAASPELMAAIRLECGIRHASKREQDHAST